ncbi:MAG: hypothetical protein JW715_10995, partial [Sedimentisphaerales bacterium]|nr:hypothetical protein [Sedimentisphaerales bacterium]
MDIKRSNYLSLFFVLLFSSFAVAQQTPVSIAIVDDKAPGLDKSPLVSLLEVELSRNENIRLLERAAIDKILREQQFNFAGLLERDAIVEAGRLLRADAFVLLSQESAGVETKPSRSRAIDELDEDLLQVEDLPKGPLIRVRVAETAHGLRLLDKFEQLDEAKPEQIAQGIADDISAVADKVNLAGEQAIPIGIVDIHRVQLGERYKLLERALPVLLSVRLSKEPKIIMLEREDLKILLDEKLLTEGKDTEFWSSAVLIDGYLQPKDGSLEMTLQLRQAAGKEIATFAVAVEPNQPSLAIDKAAIEIVKQIQNSPPSTQWQPELEAEEFCKQGQLLSAHSRYVDAMQLFETAHALQPRNVFYTGSLFVNEWDLRCEIENEKRQGNLRNNVASSRTKSPGFLDLELAELVSLLVRQIRDGYDKGQLSTRDIYYTWSKSLGYGLRRGYFAKPVSVATEQIRQINRENRKIWVETFGAALRQQPIRDGYPQMNDLVRARLAWISSDEPNELMTNLKKAFTEFIMPPELGGKTKSLEEREHLFYQAFQGMLRHHSPSYLGDCFLMGSTEEFLRLWRQYLKDVIEVEDPLVRIDGYIALSMGGSFTEIKEYEADANDYCHKAFEVMNDILKNPTLSISLSMKQQLLLRLKSLTYLRNTNVTESIQMWEEICEILIEQEDIDSLVMLDIGWRSLRLNLHDKQQLMTDSINRYYRLLERIAEVMQTHKGDNQIAKALSNIRDSQERIRRQFPDLDNTTKDNNLHIATLLYKDDWQLGVGFSSRELQIKFKNNTIWIAFKGSRINDYIINVGLVGVDLTKMKVSALWQAEVPYIPRIIPRLNGVVIGEKTSYVSIQNVGIIELPGSLTEGRELFVDSNVLSRSGYRLEILERLENQVKNGQKTFKKPKVYTQEDGLPSILITSIAKQGDKLWIAYGDRDQESGLGLYESKTGQWETVFCSTFKEKLPFSSGQPYQISSLIFINPDQLLFSVSGIEQSGLWKIDTNTRVLKYIGPIGGEIYIDLENKFWIRARSRLIEFEPILQEIKFVLEKPDSLAKAFIEKDIPRPVFKEDLFLSEPFFNKVTFGPYYTGNLDLLTSAIHCNKLWARLGESRIIIVEKSKSFEEAQIIENNILDGEPVE